jgi:DNA-binding transcriptional LysR family regulator
MQIHQLRMMAIFAKIAETGSFKMASEQLDMTPSVISKCMSDLEKELGLQLLHRSTRSLRVSEAGKPFLEACNQMLQIAHEGLTQVTASHEQPKGLLRITIPSALINEGFASFLAHFQKRYPLIDLDIDCSDERRDLIRERYDLALHIGKSPDSQLFAQSLFKTKGIICAHSSQTEMINAIQSPADLNHWPAALLPSLSGGFELCHHDSEIAKHPIKSQKTMCINSGTLIRFCLSSQSAWGVFLDFNVHQALQSGVLKRLLPNWFITADALYAITPAPLGRLPLAKLFVEMLRNETPKWGNSASLLG